MDAGAYVRRLCAALRGALLDRLDIQLTFKGEALPLQPERCWRIGLIVNELVTNVTKHARFEAQSGHVTIKLAHRDGVVNCVVTDNGSACLGGRQGQGLRIIRALARSLGGRLELGLGADFRSVVLSFQMTARELRANEATASRQQRAPRGRDARERDIAARRTEAFASRSRPSDSLGALLSARTA